jgi:UDP-N-acetylglucosamine transferase subunit ALG13
MNEVKGMNDIITSIIVSIIIQYGRLNLLRVMFGWWRGSRVSL